MLTRLNQRDANFTTQFTQLLQERSDSEASVAPIVSEIIADVRKNGDEALCRLTEKFDRVAIPAAGLRVSDEEFRVADIECPQNVKDALALAAERLRTFHEKQTPNDVDYTDEAGIRLGMRWNAITDVGIYVPGGRASYPSSVLHNAIAAKVAGVPRVVMVVPTPDGVLNPSVLVAATISGVDEVYKVGGAQAVAALAYGTDSIAPVYKIVGPGNAFVAEAKRQVFGKVGIDSIAGPSEILVVADGDNDPRWIAADLLSQAEHDPQAQSILMTDDTDFADAVDREIATMLETLPRKEIAGASIDEFGISVVVEKLDDAVALIDQVAPEHLELAVENPEALMAKIHNAGAFFLGRYTPESIGDYVAGPSHVLPTSQAARYASGLSVYDFIKKSSVIQCSQAGFMQVADATHCLAENEGLQAHGLAVTVRRDA